MPAATPMMPGLPPSDVRAKLALRECANQPSGDDDDDHLPQPKSAVADFGHFVEWPNPRYSEVRLGGGRTASAVRVGVTALPHTRSRCHPLRRCHPTPDCLRQSDPPPAGKGGHM